MFVARSVHVETSVQVKYFKKKRKANKVRFKEEAKMSKPQLSKRVKQVGVKEPIKQIDSSTWMKTSEDVFCGENIREVNEKVALNKIKTKIN